MIYDLKTNTAMSLNETSARIWRSCNGKRKAADICSYLKESDGVYVNQDLVLLALRQLSDADLLAAKMPESDKPEGVSRRKLLRQIGAGSAVALPIIHSIVAPQASVAASGCIGDPVLGGLGGQGTCELPDQRCFNRECISCVPPEQPIPGIRFCDDIGANELCCNFSTGAVCIPRFAPMLTRVCTPST